METKTIGNKIAEARKKRNLSQARLAQCLFISSQAVGKWERGESMPDIITFNRLAEILGVDLNYFSDAFQDAAPGVAKKRHNWDMSLGNWVDADFSGLKNLQEKFSSSNMQRCKFIASELRGLVLRNNRIEDCDFSRSDLNSSSIRGSHLTKSIFRNCLLQEAEILTSYIKACDFSNADFSSLVFKNSTFMGNTLDNVVWTHCSFKATTMEDLVFNGNIDDCYFENSSFKKIIFRKAVITNTFFKNRSLKGMRFEDCQVDRMTYEFLKNGKADLSGIHLIDA